MIVVLCYSLGRSAIRGGYKSVVLVEPCGSLELFYGNMTIGGAFLWYLGMFVVMLPVVLPFLWAFLVL